MAEGGDGFAFLEGFDRDDALLAETFLLGGGGAEPAQQRCVHTHARRCRHQILTTTLSPAASCRRLQQPQSWSAHLVWRRSSDVWFTAAWRAPGTSITLPVLPTHHCHRSGRRSPGPNPPFAASIRRPKATRIYGSSSVTRRVLASVIVGDGNFGRDQTTTTTADYSALRCAPGQEERRTPPEEPAFQDCGVAGQQRPPVRPKAPLFQYI